MTVILTTIITLVICGAIAGFLAGLLGIGGGIIFVPAFYFVFTSLFNQDPGVSISIAAYTSLVCMIPTSITAAIAQYKKGNTDLQVIKNWSLAMILGVIVGSSIASLYGGKWLAILFGIVMLLNSINTLFRAKAKPMFSSLPNRFFQSVISFFIAFFSVMLGIGGGTLTVPVLNACSVPPHKSIGISSAVSLFVCVPGVILSLLFASNIQNPSTLMGTYGHINFLAAICVIPLSVLFAPLGVSLGKKISPPTIKRIFAISLLIVSIKMLLSSF